MHNLNHKLEQYQKQVEQTLKNYLTTQEKIAYQTIYDATSYAVLVGGKRLRPALVLEFCQLCGGQLEQALPVAASIEMVHTYSLVHDDLPCMDNDDLRRGKPTTHKVFGEAIAVLAGDALLTRAFEALSTAPLPAQNIISIIHTLAKASGMQGMIGGQVLDIESEGKHISIDTLLELQNLKTGCLIEAACVMGCLASGRATDLQLASAHQYGKSIGLAFQIRDDVLDSESSPAILGKTTCKDIKQQKATFMTLLGKEACETKMQELKQQSIEATSAFPHALFLQELAHYIVERIY